MLHTDKALWIEDASRQAGTQQTLTVDGVVYAFRWCPAGCFVMGSPKDEKGRYDTEMPHRVTLTTGFWMLETQVTQAMWQGVMNESIDQKAQQRKSGHALAGVGANYPMYYVSWNDCQDFCRTLSDKIGLMVSLPTEAQWEYACRAGTTGPYAGDLEAMGWYVENANETSHPVAQKQPNAWGLYDMHGNLWEWCQDCWHKNHTTSSVTDPMEPILNSYRVYRGGSWYNHAISCRSARRGHFLAGYRNYRLGFRVIVIGT